MAVADVAPVLLGLVPFAVVVGVTMQGLRIPTVVALIGSAAMFSGSAQLAVLTLLGQGADFFSILAGAAVINSRLAIYGGALEPSFRTQPRWFRWLGTHFVIDQVYGLAAARRDLVEPRRFRIYWLTTSTAVGLVWLTTIGLAMNLGGSLPEASPFSFAATSLYIAMVVPHLTHSAGRRAAIASAATAIAFAGVGSGLGILAGVVTGAVAAAYSQGGR